MNDDSRLIALNSLASLYPIDRFVSLHRCKKNNYSKLKSTIVQSTQELYYLLNITLCPTVHPRNCASLIRLKRNLFIILVCILIYEFSIYRIHRKNIQSVPSLATVKYIKNERFLKKVSKEICRTLSNALNSNVSVTINIFLLRPCKIYFEFFK